MPHISKKKLEPDLLEGLLSQLIGVFKVASKQNTLSVFTEELFTSTEKIMFAKRLAAILMLNRGVPQHVISEKLKMSSSTISKLSLEIEVGKYNSIVSVTKSRSEKIINAVLDEILEFLPRPFGRYRRRFPSIYKDSSKNPYLK